MFTAPAQTQPATVSATAAPRIQRNADVCSRKTEEDPHNQKAGPKSNRSGPTRGYRAHRREHRNRKLPARENGPNLRMEPLPLPEKERKSKSGEHKAKSARRRPPAPGNSPLGKVGIANGCAAPLNSKRGSEA